MPVRNIRASLVSVLALFGLLLPISARAQTPAPADEPPPRLEVEAHAAALLTSGNATNRTFGVGGELVWRPEPWVVKAKAAYAQTEAEEVLSARSTLAQIRADRFLTVRTSLYGEYGYLRDLFAGIENRSTVIGGLAYRLIDHPAHKLTVDGGLGYEHQDEIGEESENLAIGTAGAAYRWKISETSGLSEELRYVQAFESIDNWKLDQSVTLTAAITSVLSLKLANTIRYVNEPVLGFESTDTITSVSLAWSFKQR